jgi:RimJ/RimL family protein N-acetyltransferase
MYIQADELKLVASSETDADLTVLFDNYDVLRYMSESRLHPKPMPSSIVFRIEKESRLIGEISLKTIKWYIRKAEISINLIPEKHRKGIGYKTLIRMIDYAFNTLNLYRLEAEIIEGNTASVQLFSKLGFEPEGRLRKAKYIDGHYYDILTFGLLKDEYQKPGM